MKAQLEASKNPLIQTPQSIAKNGPYQKPQGTPEFKKPDLPKPDSATKVTLSDQAKSLQQPNLSTGEGVAQKVGEELAKKEVKAQISKENKAEATEILKKEAKSLLQKPLIFFVRGLDISSGFGGIKEMGENVEGARVYGWDQYHEMMSEIKKTDPKQPLILVGHSLGGDTVHEMAEDLDSVQGGFRKVDLLVTVDAFGYDHDIIPQNVKKHINVFSESGILSDGPHVARRHDKTHVENILSPKDHTDLDDDKAIQYDILEAIHQSLKA